MLQPPICLHSCRYTRSAFSPYRGGYASEVLSRKPRYRMHLNDFTTNPGEKCRLTCNSHQDFAAAADMPALLSLYSISLRRSRSATPRLRRLLNVSRKSCHQSAFSCQLMRIRKPPRSSFANGGRKRKRASPVLSAVEELVFLDITSISVLSRSNPVRHLRDNAPIRVSDNFPRY